MVLSKPYSTGLEKIGFGGMFCKIIRFPCSTLLPFLFFESLAINPKSREKGTLIVRDLLGNS